MLLWLLMRLMSLLPFIGLFADHWDRRKIHIPVIYCIVFLVTVGWVLPTLLHVFGIWFPMAVPILLFGYVLIAKRRARVGE